MQNTFAKLFDFEESQVLVTKHFEENVENGFKLIQTTHCENVVIDLEITFNDEGERDSLFVTYGKAEATNFLELVNNISNNKQSYKANGITLEVGK